MQKNTIVNLLVATKSFTSAEMFLYWFPDLSLYATTDKNFFVANFFQY